MAPNQKPSLAARIFQGGGSAGLLGNPMFNIGMGLLAKGQDNRIPYATAVMGGLQDAQAARSAVEQREILRQQQERDARLEALRLQEILEKRQRNELAMQQGQQRTQAFNTAVDAQFPNLRPPMMNAGQPDPRAGLLRALGPDALPAKVLEGLLADGSGKRERAPIQPPSAKDFTAASMKRYQESDGDASLLERLPRFETVKMPDGGVIVMDRNTGQKVENAGISVEDLKKREQEGKYIDRSNPDYKVSVYALLDSIESLEKTDLSPVLGYYDSRTPTILSSSADLEADLANLLAVMSVAEAGKLKGQGNISEGERDMLKASISVLSSRDISVERAKKALEEARERVLLTINPEDREKYLEELAKRRKNASGGNVLVSSE